MDKRELCYLDIACLGRLYRSGEVSPVEVTQAVLERIHALDERLNAFITVLDEPALACARQAEAELHAGKDRGKPRPQRVSKGPHPQCERFGGAAISGVEGEAANHPGRIH